MSPPTRPRKRLRLFVVTLLGASVLVAPALAGMKKKPPTIEAFNEGIYGFGPHFWKPSSAAITTGGSVNLANPTTVNHGVEWKSGPGTPSCTAGVPVGTSPASSGNKWSGSCTFTKPGTYTFWCTVHGAEMTGTVTVTTPPPAIKRVAPRKGPDTGETMVTITGTNFTGAEVVKFGSVEAKTFAVTSDTSITAVSPAEAAGTVDVSITTPYGTSVSSHHDHFRFVAPKA
jgi:plastocyanin